MAQKKVGLQVEALLAVQRAEAQYGGVAFGVPAWDCAGKNRPVGEYSDYT